MYEKTYIENVLQKYNINKINHNILLSYVNIILYNILFHRIYQLKCTRIYLIIVYNIIFSALILCNHSIGKLIVV